MQSLSTHMPLPFSALTLEAEHQSWPLAEAFTISRGSKTSAEVVVATVRASLSPTGPVIEGRGECVPYARYGETVAGVLESLRLLPRPDPLLLPAGAARNALDCALWDWVAKARGCSVASLIGLRSLTPIQTAETISLAPPAQMAAKAATLAARPLLKVKVGSDDPLSRVQAVRSAAPAARLIVDANEGWSLEQLRALLPDLAALDCALIEQPLPAEYDGALADLGPCLVPLCADESVHASDSLASLVGRYQAVNIKLDKTGGLSEALCLHRQATNMGFHIMVGCMVATSLAMAPAFLLAQNAAFVDLDGPVFLAKDRPEGLIFSNGKIDPPGSILWG